MATPHDKPISLSQPMLRRPLTIILGLCAAVSLPRCRCFGARNTSPAHAGQQSYQMVHGLACTRHRSFNQTTRRVAQDDQTLKEHPLEPAIDAPRRDIFSWLYTGGGLRHGYSGSRHLTCPGYHSMGC